MKKIIAVILALVSVLTLSLTALAASPTASPVYKITLAGVGGVSEQNNSQNSGSIDKNASKKLFTITVDENCNIVATADANAGRFDGWKIYKANSGTTGNVGVTNTLSVNAVAAINFTVATPGVDYTVVSGSLTSNTLVIKPHTDLIITANYGGVVTNPETGEPTSDKSPATGDMLLVYASVAMLAVLSVAFIYKKVKN